MILMQKYPAVPVKKTGPQDIGGITEKGDKHGGGWRVFNMSIWVFAEQKDGEVADVALEIMSGGRALADRSGKALVAVSVGCDSDGIADRLGRYGADSIQAVWDERLKDYSPELYTRVLEVLIYRCLPSVILFGATPVGSDLAPRVSARMRAGLIPGCDKIQLSEDGRLSGTRLWFRNKLHETVTYSGQVQMATIVPGAFQKKKRPAGTDLGKIKIQRNTLDEIVDANTQRTKTIDFIKADHKTIDISDADVIVSGGRGVGGKNHFEIIYELADLLKAAVAGSRMAVDEGCIPRARQIGQSGKTVSPELMISCGISGATAHTYGMREAKTIIAINTDKGAPIMKIADLGVVGDVREVIPALNKRLRGLED